MKKRKRGLNSILYDNRFVFIFSAVAAIVIWFIVAIQFSPTTQRVVQNVSVKIDPTSTMESFGLQLFGQTEFFVDVTVSGKRYEVAESALTANDIVVIAKTDYVDSAGKQRLTLVAQKANSGADYEILSISEETIEVFVDVLQEKEMGLETNIIYNGGDTIAPEGYFADYEVLSISNVTVSGPATEVSKVTRVVASVAIEEQITKTTTLSATITPLNEYGSEPRYIEIAQADSVTMTIPVYKRVTMPVSVSFKNAPAALSELGITVTCSPAKAQFGISEDQLDSMTSVSVGTVDFTTLSATSKTYAFSVTDLSGVKVFDNTQTFRVTIDASAMRSKYFALHRNNTIMQNTPAGMTVELTSGIQSDVRVIGTQEAIAALAESDLYADVDLSGIEAKNGTQTVEARVYVKGSDSCWVYGSYKVTVRVTLDTAS